MRRAPAAVVLALALLGPPRPAAAAPAASAIAASAVAASAVAAPVASAPAASAPAASAPAASAPAAPAPARSADDAVAAALARMHAAYEGVTAIAASFRQTSTGVSFFEPLHQAGTVALLAPAKMRWDFVTPRKQSFVSDGRTLWVLDELDRTATTFSSVDAMLARFHGFLTGKADLERDFLVSLADEPPAVPGATVLALVPREPDGAIEALRVAIDAATGRVVAVTTITPYGDRTETVLADVRTPRDLASVEFSFAPRPGWRVVRGD